MTLSTDYLAASLPTLAFDAKPAIDWASFVERCGGEDGALLAPLETGAWHDLETQLRNACAEARHGAKYARPAVGCSLYWRNRVLVCFQEADIGQRERLLDKVWWDAAGELTPPTSPLGAGAIRTYAIRLKIALKRAAIATDAGNAAFERLTQETKIQ